MKTRRWLAAVVLTVTGCSSLQSVPVGFIAETKPAVVYLSDGFGAVTTVANPRVSGDSVLGTVPGEAREVAVPLRDVQRVKAVRMNSGRTAMLVAGMASAAALVTYAVIARARGSNDGFCDYDNQPMSGSECGYPSNP